MATKKNARSTTIMFEKEEEERPDPYAPMKCLPPETREAGMESNRLILAERDRIEAGKKANPKPPEVTPDEQFHQQDSAA